MAQQEPHSTEFADHDDALLREAAQRLVDTMAPYRVLTRDQLEILSGAGKWRSVSFEHALQWAVKHGVLGRLSDDLYEIPRRAGPLSPIR